MNTATDLLRTEVLPSLDTSDPWPRHDLFRAVCKEGLSKVRPLTPEARLTDAFGWNFGSANVPSYQAYGRLRALFSLQQALSLRPARVLEVAAGDASLCASLAELAGCETVANDLRRESLENAVRLFHNAASIRLLSGNLFELDPGDTGRFDLVVACEIIEHVAHTVEFLEQLRRFVAPGGKLLLTTPNGGYFHNKLPTHSQIEDYTALESRQFKPDADGHLFLITPDEMVDLATRSGFRVERMHLWATPAITGHCGMRLLGTLGLSWPWYKLETLLHRLPAGLRSKLCFEMSAVLSPLD